MELWSNDFSEGEPIPGEFAFCLPDADTHVRLAPNRNPHLAWSGVPDGTKSLAIIIHDRDVPTKPDDVNQEDREVPADLARADFFHWTLIDVSPETTEIERGTFADGVVPRGKDAGDTPPWTRHGLNDYTGWFAEDPDMGGDYYGYDGPCPPWNDSLVHHYVFSIFALDTERLDLSEGFDGTAVRSALEDHVLESAQLIGTYTLNPRLS